MRGWDLQIRQLLLAKFVIYGWLFAFARLILPITERPSKWKPIVAATLRLLLGLALGLPLGMLLYRFGSGVAIAAFSLFRLGLWMSVTRMLFPRISWTANGLFSLAATGLNTALDFSLGHWATEGYGLC